MWCIWGLVSCIGAHVEPYSLKIYLGPYFIRSPFISNDPISEHFRKLISENQNRNFSFRRISPVNLAELQVQGY